MAFFSKAVVAAYIIASAAATPLLLPHKFGPLTIFQTLEKVPNQWVAQGPASNDTKLQVQIGLKQSNIPELQEKLLDISNPHSANYGKWLSKEEVNELTAPPLANIALVKAWLAFVGVHDVSQSSPDWISFTAPISKMEEILDAKYDLFYHPGEGRAMPRTLQYSVPKLLHPLIDMITPTTAFYTNIEPKPTGEKLSISKKSLDKRASCPSTVTPSCIDSLYDVDYTSKGTALVATTEFIQVAASHSDYSTFASDFAPGAAQFQDVSVSGGTNAGSGSENTLLEGNLDTQFVGGVSKPNPSQYLACGPNGQNFNDQISNFASYLTSASSPPTAVSTSYGGEEQDFSTSYLTRICNEFMKAGSLGISIFFSSGDHGVGGNGESSCNDGFYAVFPASCPWSTAVGGTQFNGNTEVVADFSAAFGAPASPGGGFSYVFSRPSYQSSAVSTYLNTIGSLDSGYYNSNGRGYPDVALVAVNFEIVVNGALVSVLGTSASSPSWAALVSVLNDYRKSQGLANLGFLNTLLYSSSTQSALNDITSGSNQGCNSNGFPAEKGWDAASGLGSLNFAKLRAMI